MSPTLVENDIEQSTSAGSPMLENSVYNLLTYGEWELGSSMEQQQVSPLQDQTNSGVRAPESQSSSSALMELRRISGLTWDQLARLFDVTRRSLHFWVSGKPLNSVNEERLNRLLDMIRKLDRGSASENRSLLLSAREDGVIPFDLLLKERYGEVLFLLGPGPTLSRLKPSPLSEEATRARKPLPPEVLAGALEDSVHKEIGKVRIPRVAKDRK